MLIGIDASRAFVKERTGTENYSLNLIKALAEIDGKNEYRLYVRNTHYRLSNTDWPNNFKFVEIFWPRFWTQIGLAFEVLKNPPDVLFIPAHTLPVIPTLARPGLARLKKTKCVVTIHDLGYEFLPQYHSFWSKIYLNKSTEYAARFATRLIAVSNSTKADLVSKLKADPGKIDVVYEGVDREKWKVEPCLPAGRSGKWKVEEILNKYNLKTPYILFVGTVQPRKNLERLIEAFSKVIRKYGNREIGTKNLKIPSPNNLSTLQLVIVGKLGWMYEDILKAPKKFAVQDRVKFLDYVIDADLPQLYQGANLFVMPSLAEGFGLPLLEAMASGIPIVSSYISLF